MAIMLSDASMFDEEMQRFGNGGWVAVYSLEWDAVLRSYPATLAFVTFVSKVTASESGLCLTGFKALAGASFEFWRAENSLGEIATNVDAAR